MYNKILMTLDATPTDRATSRTASLAPGSSLTGTPASRSRYKASASEATAASIPAVSHPATNKAVRIGRGAVTASASPAR